MKKIYALCLAAVLLCIPARAAVVGSVLTTDIHAYIDYLMVPSYNIDGSTAVVVRDLENFGYTVNWNESTRTVDFYRDYSKPLTPTIPAFEPLPVGTRLFDVQSTDIRTFFRGIEIPSYNIGGRTAVRLRDLALVRAASFDESTRSADIFCYDVEYFDDEIQYIKGVFYEKLLLLSRADLALQPLICMLESGVYDETVAANYRAFFYSFLQECDAFKAYNEPYGFDNSAMELWWAMVNMRYACETAAIMTEILQNGGNHLAAMYDYKQYRIDCLEQRRIALITLNEDMMRLSFVWD